MNQPPIRFCLPVAAALLAGACAKHSGSIAEILPLGSPRFETRTEVNSGTGSHAAFEVADLDGDTFLDMAVVGTTGELRVLLGNGTNFVAGQLLQLGGVPVWIDGADFDLDGDRDLAVLRTDAASVDIFLNDGAATFTPGPVLQVSADSLTVTAVEISGDGIVDLVVSRPSAPELQLFVGDGVGGFASVPSVAIPGGGSSYFVAAADVTRDGVVDVLVADPLGSRVLIYPGGPLAAPVPFELAIAGEPRALSFGDLSGDGHADVVVSAFAASKFVVVTDIDFNSGPGPLTFTSSEVPLAASAAVSTVGDVTGDGLADLVGCQLGSASIVVIPQLAGGLLGEPMQLDATGLPLWPVIGDFDQNGQNDLCALSGLGDRINLWLADGSGRLLGARNYDSGLRTAAFLGGADFDGDGDFEIAVGGPDGTTVSIMERRPDGVLVSQQLIDVGAVVMQIHAVDLDVDGKPDLLAAVGAGLKILRNRSTTAGYDFELLPGFAVALGAAQAPFGITAADIDRDGDNDLVACDYAGDSVRIVLGTATPFVYGNEIVVPVAGGPVDVEAADFTGDGNPDLAISRAGMSDIQILQGDGAGGFAPFLAVPVGTAPNYLITGDFNRDLRADLVVSNASSNSITVLFGGVNGFTGQTYPAGRSPTALLADDLTGDGIDDVLVTSLQSGDFHVLVGDGFGSFPELTRFPGTLGASDALLLDMDGDGREDLLITSLITSRVSLVRNIRE